jgi:hypothetical protein
MTHFAVYVTDHKNNTLELPVAPEEVLLSWENANETVEIVNLGEVSRIGGRKINEISIKSSLPINMKNAHYTTAQKLKNSADDYLSFFQNWLDSAQAGRLVVSTTSINRRMQVVRVDYGFVKGNMDEYVYTLVLRDYKEMTLRNKNLPVPPPPKPKPPPAAKIGIGSTVIVNGQLFRDSYGTGRGLVERNATRKINFMALGRSKPYHVTMLDGGWRGWVSADSVRLL